MMTIPEPPVPPFPAVPEPPPPPPPVLAVPLSPAVLELPALPAPPPNVIIQIPQGQPIYSIDVECVASGVQHNARSIAQVALVDEWNRCIFCVLIKQEVTVASYITELTGLTKELLDIIFIKLKYCKKIGIEIIVLE